MVINLHAIKQVIKRRKQVESSVLSRSHAAVVSVRPAAPVQSFSEGSSAAKTAPALAIARSSHTNHPRWIKFLHAYFVVHGLAALSLLFVGNRDAVAEGLPDCKLVMSRWLVPRVPCAVLEINCRRDSFKSLDAASMLAIFDKADRNALRALTFVGCDSLVMPDMIRLFPRLHWLEIRNSTVVQWPRSAAITRETTPRLTRLLVLETNLTEFPRVLYENGTATIPQPLLDITFAGANLTDLPETLHAAWPQPMASLIFERCGFSTVPQTLLAMRTDVLSLAGNQIRAIPPSFFAGKTFSLLSLAGNPIETLPATLTSPLALRASPTSTQPRGLWLVDTPITALPTWTCGLRGDVVGAGSPLCADGTSEAAACDVPSLSPLRCAPPATASASISPAGFLVSLD